MQGVLNGEYSQERRNLPAHVFRYKTRTRLLRYAIDKFLSPAAHPRLLDLGAADGLTLLELNNLLRGGWEFSGIEYSAELIADAPALPANISLTRGDITQPLMEQGREQFQVVSALAVLEHLKNPETAVRNAALALKKGGIFVATAPVPVWDRLSSSLGLLKEAQHECGMDRDALVACLHAAELEVEEFGKFMWAPISCLPYLGIRFSPAVSLKIDAMVRKFKIFNFLFVNQYIVGRKT